MRSVRRYLSDIKRIKIQLMVLRQQLENTHIDLPPMHSTSGDDVRVQTSPKNTMEEAGWRLLERQSEYRREMIGYTEQLNKRLELIRLASRPLYAKVLYAKYYEEKDTETIAEEMKIQSAKAVANYCSAAIKDLERIVKAEHIVF